MHIAEVAISGYRGFAKGCTICLNEGLTVLLGENGSGKSGVVDSLRLLFLDDEYGRAGILPSDFHRSLAKAAKDPGSASFSIDCSFEGLNEEQQIACLPWLDAGDPTKASLHLLVENRQDARGRPRRTVWGGAAKASAFEPEIIRDGIDCVYLPPLRDAEERLRAYRGSRLARLLKNLRDPVPEGQEHPLEAMAREQNRRLAQDKLVRQANGHIRTALRKALGSVLGQDVLVQFSETNFDRIVEKLRLLFYPLVPEQGKETPEDLFRELSENSLGYNNLLYLATILAEIEAGKAPGTLFRLLLIEEPEAHLHPQLQTRVLQYLEGLSRRAGIQVVVTSHSPTIAAAVGSDAVTVLTVAQTGACPESVSPAECGLTSQSKSFLARWLDVTKSTLLFARGVILVEGIAEALVVPELAKMVLRELVTPRAAGNGESSEGRPAADESARSLQDYGVSVINMGGIFFEHFMQLFRGDMAVVEGPSPRQPCKLIPIRCAGITDFDPKKYDQQETTRESTNPQAYLVKELADNEFCRLYINECTFEYDLGLPDQNLRVLGEVLAEITASNGEVKQHAHEMVRKDWSNVPLADKQRECGLLLKRIDRKKGEFAQALADRLARGNVQFAVPDYIRKAILWTTQPRTPKQHQTQPAPRVSDVTTSC